MKHPSSKRGAKSAADALSDAELDRLAEFLDSAGDQPMNLEELDGFFSALIAGPETVMPSEYWPEVLRNDDFAFDSTDQAREIIELTNRHWNTIAATLHAGDVHVPIILLDDKGEGRGNDWARGFMRGAELRWDSWRSLLDDEQHAGALIPMMMLEHEHDPDPSLRPPAIAPDKRH